LKIASMPVKTIAPDKTASHGKTPAQQLAGFLAKFEPRVAAAARAALARLRKRLPGAFELVYGARETRCQEIDGARVAFRQEAL
jgi:hypothetical protein